MGDYIFVTHSLCFPGYVSVSAKNDFHVRDELIGGSMNVRAFLLLWVSQTVLASRDGLRAFSSRWERDETVVCLKLLFLEAV